MFVGCYVCGIDEKNRVSIPAKLRRDLSDPFVLSKGPDGCLWGLSTDQWDLVLSRAGKSVAIQRFFLASAVECYLGQKGRCLLPDILRKHADIKPHDEVVVVGLSNRIEIWSLRRWEIACSQLTSERARQELPELFVV